MFNNIKIQIHFKSGKDLFVILKSLKIVKNDDNTIARLEWDGLVNPKSITYIDLSEIEYIIRVN